LSDSATVCGGGRNRDLYFFTPAVPVHVGGCCESHNSGKFLGTLVFPANTGYGQVATFDVTLFLQSVKGPYFGFILQSTNSDTLSSLSYNYGTPPELIAAVSTLPPKLIAKHVGNQLVISWNTNNAAGLSLQFTTNLTSATGLNPGILPPRNYFTSVVASLK
jgi:hypothetical protein